MKNGKRSSPDLAGAFALVARHRFSFRGDVFDRGQAAV